MSFPARRRLWNFFESLYGNELTETSPRAPTPAWLKTPLLPHQQSAYAAALKIETAKSTGIAVAPCPGESHGGTLFSSHGILGDRVGSGKSLIALALVKAPLPSTDYTEYVVRGGMYLGDGRDVGLLRNRSQLQTSLGTKLTPVGASLFIVPHALMSQWESYVKNDTKLKALFIKRKQDALSDTFLTDLPKYDVVFVSSTMWLAFRTTTPLRTVLWQRVFIDEADSINISTDADEIHGLFYWFITASWFNLVFSNGLYLNIQAMYSPLPETPPSIVNRVYNLQGANTNLHVVGLRHNNIVRRMCNGTPQGYQIFSVNAAGIQASRLIVFNNEEYIKTSFSPVAITHTNILCETPANIRVLDSLISNDMLERLNAGDVTGALELCGMTARTTESLTDAVTANLQKDLDNAKKTYEFKKSIEYSSPSSKASALELCTTKIASIQSRISAIEERIKSVKEQMCPICYCEVSNASITPCCQQLFCLGCILESLKRVAACPLCRARIEDVKSLNVLGETNTTAPIPEAVKKRLNKKAAFIKYVLENKTQKILMFSGYDGTFAGLEKELEDNAVAFATLNGSQARINKLLREFEAGKYSVLFLNARNMGAGLNILAATHVMLFHKMAPELEAQIIGRAHRMGRTMPLEVVHLLHDNELTLQPHPESQTNIILPV